MAYQRRITSKRWFAAESAANTAKADVDAALATKTSLLDLGTWTSVIIIDGSEWRLDIGTDVIVASDMYEIMSTIDSVGSTGVRTERNAAP